jgi:hypothetical protein
MDLIELLGPISSDWVEPEGEEGRKGVDGVDEPGTTTATSNGFGVYTKAGKGGLGGQKETKHLEPSRCSVVTKSPFDTFESK